MRLQDFSMQLAASESPLAGHAIRTCFRTYLDPNAAEWDETTLAEKRAFVNLLNQVALSFDELVESYKIFWAGRGRSDISAAADLAVEILQVEHASS